MPKRRTKSEQGSSHWFLVLLLLCVMAAVGWSGWVYRQIEQVAREDQARGADAIAVFGAAHYHQRPSPTFHARLDHAVALYSRQIAPVVITLGGSADPKDASSEAAVGRDYLLANGIPYDHIITETRSTDTEEQAVLLAKIARENGFHTVVVVSDPTHLFRIRELCHQQGLDVLTSPRPQFGRISRWDAFTRVMHEILGYTAIRLHLNSSWLHRWLEGKEDSL